MEWKDSTVSKCTTGTDGNQSGTVGSHWELLGVTWNCWESFGTVESH